METLNYSCAECSAKLWSDYSKKLGVCPECKEPDKETEELEAMIESLLD